MCVCVCVCIFFYSSFVRSLARSLTYLVVSICNAEAADMPNDRCSLLFFFIVQLLLLQQQLLLLILDLCLWGQRATENADV